MADTKNALCLSIIPSLLNEEQAVVTNKLFNVKLMCSSGSDRRAVPLAVDSTADTNERARPISTAPTGLFHVAVHDVTPHQIEPLKRIIDQVSPLIDNRLSAAVVPCWHGTELSAHDREFCRWVVEHCGEIHLHGFTHWRPRGLSLVASLTGRANEFSRLPSTAIHERLRDGQQLLRKHFGRAARGFVPPAWCRGLVTADVLEQHGLHYLIGFNRAESVHGARLSLTTWNWDWGVISRLSPIAELITSARRARALQCVVFHPADVGRAFLGRGIEQVKRLLAEGNQPVLFDEVW